MKNKRKFLGGARARPPKTFEDETKICAIVFYEKYVFCFVFFLFFVF